MQHASFWKKRVVAAALLLLALATPSPVTRAQDAEVDLALVLAVDCSFSVDFREFALQMRGLGEAFRKPEIKRAIAMGNLQRIAVSVVQWSDESNQVVAMPWTILESEEDGISLRNACPCGAAGRCGTSISMRCFIRQPTSAGPAGPSPVDCCVFRLRNMWASR